METSRYIVNNYIVKKINQARIVFNTFTTTRKNRCGFAFLSHM